MFANGRYDVNDQTPPEIPKHGRIGRRAWLRGSPPFGRSPTSSAVLYLKQVEARARGETKRPPISRRRSKRSR